ncbi:hypothetical protein [Homoserinibacter sp. GY 40078]|uniref:hypothetical protein n=1 Tax=Homoserinibacter sp. GY 40078 TaxID=2603275 RepID=UPI0011C72088|nr:hypothetical protein [Homoserinibacter sp. GY 40078]TXK17376.1 hypothetical protein FVQ89_11115 [Homoserinibacter sp. GY 40078]
MSAALTLPQSMRAAGKPLVGTTLGVDAPRVRRGDRDNSHVAADASARSIHETKLRVLQIVLQEGPIIGAEINDLYDLRRSRNGWRKIHVDSPRKRAGELAADGLLEIVRDRVNPANHLPEAEYAITDAGRAALGKLS